MKAFGLTFQRLQDNLFVASGRNDFAYSDGHIEEARILEIVNSATDISSSSWELHEKANTWPERYHLSIHRGAIIRCLSAPAKIRVLEMGAGAGAITRALGEKFASVDAIEGSIDRARICASRCRNLPNVRVFAADINRISPEPAYDLVFLIGVLEWSKGFIEGNNPVQRCIQIASAMLKENGRLVLAIENQIGLKYFLGSGEDHCGIPMESLQGYPSFNRAETFPRLKLTGILKHAGLAGVQFMYPFPDYKLARVVLTDGAVALCSESIAYWASRYKFEDYHVPDRYNHGNQTLVATEIAKAGLLGELGNSFLVVAARQESGIDDPPWLVWSERVTKNAALCSITTLENGDSQLLVRKVFPRYELLRESLSESGFELRLLQPQLFVDGTSIEIELLRCAIGGRETAFIDIVNEWLVYVKKRFKTSDGKLIQSIAWDCIPRNLLRLANGEIADFDLEFGRDQAFKIEELCGRGLICWFADHAEWAVSLYPHVKTSRDKIQRILTQLFISNDAGNILESVTKLETQFQQWVHQDRKLDPLSGLNLPVRSGDAGNDLIERLRAREAEFAQLQEHAHRLELFSDTIRQTLAYRLYRRFIRPLMGY